MTTPTSQLWVRTSGLDVENRDAAGTRPGTHDDHATEGRARAGRHDDVDRQAFDRAGVQDRLVCSGDPPCCGTGRPHLVHRVRRR